MQKTISFNQMKLHIFQGASQTWNFYQEISGSDKVSDMDKGRLLGDHDRPLTSSSFQCWIILLLFGLFSFHMGLVFDGALKKTNPSGSYHARIASSLIGLNNLTKVFGLCPNHKRVVCHTFRHRSSTPFKHAFQCIFQS